MPPSKNISFDELSKYFHLPINQVAKELGVCATILKKICRRNGIPRWPHRKIKSLDKMIFNLNMNLEKNPTEKEDILREIELLKSKKLEIMKNPDVLVTKSVIPNRTTEVEMLTAHGKIITTKYRLHDGTPYSYKTSRELETAEVLNCFAPQNAFKTQNFEPPKPMQASPLKKSGETLVPGEITPQPPQGQFVLPHPYNPPPATNNFGNPPGVTLNFMVPSFDYPTLDLPAIRLESRYRSFPPITADSRSSPQQPTFALPDWFTQEKDRVLKAPGN